MKTDYQRIVYYPKTDKIVTQTMIYLHWFRFFVRNSEDYIKVPTEDSQSKFPNKAIRMFFIMRSDEGTHAPATYEAIAARLLTYAQWRALIDKGLCDAAVAEICAVMANETREHLEWQAVEFVGWTTDELVQNPEENKNAFRLSGHLTKPKR
jgi:hypothetical protein